MEEKNKCGLHCIKAENISVKIGKDEIIKDINIHIHCGELTVIIGKNGAGKSTLLKALLGEVNHTGQINIYDKRQQKYDKLKIGYVPQNMNIEKHMPTTVYDFMAAMTSKIPIWLKKDTKTYNKIKTHLQTFEAQQLIDKSLGDLSGGELQRVLLAVATLSKPNLLILDEPVSGIDRNGTKLFFEQIDTLKKQQDLAIILVSHDLNMVQKYADKVILLNKTIIKQGTSEEVFNSTEYKEIFE